MPHYQASDGQIFYFDELPKDGVRKDLTWVSDEYVANRSVPEPEPVDAVKDVLTDILRGALLSKGHTPEEVEEMLSQSPY